MIQESWLSHQTLTQPLPSLPSFLGVGGHEFDRGLGVILCPPECAWGLQKWSLNCFCKDEFGVHCPFYSVSISLSACSLLQSPPMDQTSLNSVTSRRNQDTIQGAQIL